MHLRTRTWLVICVLSLVGAAIFWRLGEQKLATRRAVTPAPVPPASPAPPPSSTNPISMLTERAASVPPFMPASLRSGQARPSTAAVNAEADPLRLRNTTRPIDEL